MQVKEAELKFDNVEIVGGLQMTFVLSFMHFCIFQIFYKEHVSLLYLEEKMNITFFREKKCDVTGAITDVQRATEQDGEQPYSACLGQFPPMRDTSTFSQQASIPQNSPSCTLSLLKDVEDK